MVLWPAFVTHLATFTGEIAASSYILRRSSHALLEFIAGLVAIFAKDKRSRANRALEVLRSLQRTRKPIQLRRDMPPPRVKLPLGVKLPGVEDDQ